MLLRLGDLTAEEIASRSAEPAAVEDWISKLVSERRVLDVRIAGERRFIAAEDAGRYRDALGVGLPLGLPASFLKTDDSYPLVSLLRRYARTHGPFVAGDPARRFGLAEAPVVEALRRLAAAGTVVEGQFRPGQSGAEWVDTGVLRTLRGRSLARLRREVEPVDQDALGRFAVAWHGIDSGARGPAAPMDAIGRLEGARVPASGPGPRRHAVSRRSSAPRCGTSSGPARSQTTASTRYARCSRRFAGRAEPIQSAARCTCAASSASRCATTLPDDGL